MAEQLPLAFEFKANQTFDDFYAGGNQEIVDQLKKTVLGIGEQFLFIWGDTGHGKSHLLHACCSEAFKTQKSSFFLDGANSTSLDPEIIAGLENFEVVCLDNVDKLVGNQAWELVFFNFFNQHRDRKHRLILSASQAPTSLAFMLPDLATRMRWGLALKIQSLADADKMAALTFKAKQMGFDISKPVSQFLITHYDRNLASLWVLLEKLDWASLAAQRKLSVPFLKKILK